MHRNWMGKSEAGRHWLEIKLNISVCMLSYLEFGISNLNFKFWFWFMNFDFKLRILILNFEN